MMIRHVKFETGEYTYDTETGKWTKLSDVDDGNETSSLTAYKVMEEETPLDLRPKIVKPMPGNYIPELSSNNDIWDLGRRLRSREEDKG